MGLAQTGCVLLLSHRAGQIYVPRLRVLRCSATFVQVDTTPDDSTGFKKIIDTTGILDHSETAHC